MQFGDKVIFMEVCGIYYYYTAKSVATLSSPLSGTYP